MRRFLIALAVGMMLPIFTGGCHTNGAGGTTEPGPQAQLPPVPKLEFTGAEEGWPPKPKGRTNVASVDAARTARAATAIPEDDIRRTALQDPRTRDLLGERYSYISTSEIDPPKDRREATRPKAYRVTFYSYTNNKTVEVVVNRPVTGAEGREATGMQALRADSKKSGYQPPEGPEEITAAVRHAQKALGSKVQNLLSDAILSMMKPGQPGFNHRVFYVTFSKAALDPPLYWAYVDLTDEKILSSGPKEQPQP